MERDAWLYANRFGGITVDFSKHPPKIEDGFSFDDGGYTRLLEPRSGSAVSICRRQAARLFGLTREVVSKDKTEYIRAKVRIDVVGEV